MRLPGEQTEGFHLVLPFVPENRQNMVAWMAAASDPEHYGDLVAIRFPNDRVVEGPAQVFSRINADRSFSSQRSLLDQAGSTVDFGDFLVVPIEDSLLYVQPVYVRASTSSSIPELKFVLVVNGSGGPISLGNDLQEALDVAVEGGVTQPGQNGGPPSGGPLAGRIRDLLDRALTHFQAADAALQAGNLGLYQDELAQAQTLVQQAEQLAASRGGGGPSASPTPPPSGSASPAPPTSAASPTSPASAPASASP